MVADHMQGADLWMLTEVDLVAPAPASLIKSPPSLLCPCTTFAK